MRSKRLVLCVCHLTGRFTSSNLHTKLMRVFDFDTDTSGVVALCVSQEKASD